MIGFFFDSICLHSFYEDRSQFDITLGPTCNVFGYNEHLTDSLHQVHSQQCLKVQLQRAVSFHLFTCCVTLHYLVKELKLFCQERDEDDRSLP